LLRIRQGLKDQLAAFAKREHRSLNQQIEFILEHFLSDTAKTPRSEQPAREGRQGKNQGADKRSD